MTYLGLAIIIGIFAIWAFLVLFLILFFGVVKQSDKDMEAFLNELQKENKK